MVRFPDSGLHIVTTVATDKWYWLGCFFAVSPGNMCIAVSCWVNDISWFFFFLFFLLIQLCRYEAYLSPSGDLCLWPLSKINSAYMHMIKLAFCQRMNFLCTHTQRMWCRVCLWSINDFNTDDENEEMTKQWPPTAYREGLIFQSCSFWSQ